MPPRLPSLFPIRPAHLFPSQISLTARAPVSSFDNTFGTRPPQQQPQQQQPPPQPRNRGYTPSSSVWRLGGMAGGRPSKTAAARSLQQTKHNRQDPSLSPIAANKHMHRMAEETENKLQETMNKKQRIAATNEFLHWMPLKFVPGDCYSPHDLTPGEQRHYHKRPSHRRLRGKGKDDIEEKGIYPLDLYKNYTMISRWTLNSGRIKHSDLTGYRPVNQRRIAKAVRRSMGMGIYPTTFPHPEIFALTAPVEMSKLKIIARGGNLAREGMAAEAAREAQSARDAGGIYNTLQAGNEGAGGEGGVEAVGAISGAPGTGAGGGVSEPEGKFENQFSGAVGGGA